VTRPRSLVVAHETDRAGIDCSVAAALSELLGNDAVLCRISGTRRAFPAPGSVEHVVAEGPLQPNGVYWLERSGCAMTSFERLYDRDPPNPVVVSINPFLLEAEAVAEIRSWATGRANWVTVETTKAGHEVFLGDPQGGRRLVRQPLRRDDFGRLAPLAPGDLIPEVAEAIGIPLSELCTSPRRISAEGDLRVIVVGAQGHLLDVYPAVLASLGDAADQLGLELRIHCLPPDERILTDWSEELKEVDGLVLPGGSDMSQVKAQIAAATSAFHIDLPTLGLCLGMQTMTTAFLRRVAGASDADLEETTPASPIHSFIRLRDAKGEPAHYLGERAIAVQPGTCLSTLYGGLHVVERLNHRYHLAPELAPILGKHGLLVTARTADTGVAQGIEAPGHRFFIGIQGHPELRSRRGKPHPVVLGFLSAAARKTKALA